ncbi:MAG TPA: 50S ribosomal protein L21 [Candidatus Paceibacterota bacterium]|jgi:large subunit ribosomal protein L21|nr:50S ribosomal protein L21 [Candidatus Paceibacterota bacterium]
MTDFAIIETGGKQYRVSAGQKIKIEKLASAADGKSQISFDKVLLRSTGGRVEIGAPHVAGAAVKAEIVGNGRGEKKIIFKYHSKTRQHKKKGHRQEYTEVAIAEI